jgi:1-acyl-sn-glycerol-3-phosphate acyltransferase
VSDEAWARSEPACLVREGLLSAVFRPLIALWARRDVTGVKHLDLVERPVIFVANHCSHMDTPLMLRALPWRWRRRTGVAAAADYFYDRRWMAAAVSLAFNTVPVERNGARGRDDAVALLDCLLDQDWSILVFAEGTRSRTGVIGPLQSGAAVLSARHRVPIVPVYIGGTHATMPPGRRWMRRRPSGRRQHVRVAFGAPIAPGPLEQRREVMEQVRLFFESQGAPTTPNRRIATNREQAVTTTAGGR